MKCFPFLVAVVWIAAFSARGIEYEALKFEGKKYTACRVDLDREKLELFLNDESGKPFNRFATLTAWLEQRGRGLTFAMNAGMYHAGFAPVGLFVASGRQVTPVNLDKGEGNFFLKPNGVFLVTAGGAQVVESSQVGRIREKVELATQSGPLLLLHGKLHSAFKPNSENRLFRNGVGVHSPRKVIFVNSEEPVNFDEFARVFRDQLKCPNALFLDGTVSSLHAQELNRSDFRIDLGPIIGVTVPLEAK